MATGEAAVRGRPVESKSSPSALGLINESRERLVGIVPQLGQVISRHVTHGDAGRQASAGIDDPLINTTAEPAEIVEADVVEGASGSVWCDPHLGAPAPQKLIKAPTHMRVDA